MWDNMRRCSMTYMRHALTMPTVCLLERNNLIFQKTNIYGAWSPLPWCGLVLIKSQIFCFLSYSLFAGHMWGPQRWSVYCLSYNSLAHFADPNNFLVKEWHQVNCLYFSKKKKKKLTVYGSLSMVFVQIFKKKISVPFFLIKILLTKK